MAGITLAEAEAKLALWLQVEEDIALNGQSTAILGREFRSADLSAVQKNVEIWNNRVKQLAANTGGTGIRVRGITPG